MDKEKMFYEEIREKIGNFLPEHIILQKIAEAYRIVYGDNLVKVMMYGSYARGDYDEYSDVDIVAIVHGEMKELQNALRKIWDISCELELEYETIVSPTVIPFDEYEQYRDDIENDNLY